MIPSHRCDSPMSKRALETCDLDSNYKSPPLGRHLSKSASELSSPREPPEIRPFSAAPPGSVHLSVVQKTHSFFTQLRSRWARSKSRERLRRKSPGRHDRDSTDYAADLSSDHSSPSTQSPRHRQHTVTDSPLARSCGIESHCSSSGSPKTRAQTPGNVAGLDLLPLQTTDESARRREAALRQHSFFQMRIHLKRGHGLVAMDKNGTSDPYVKFKTAGRLVFKSRTVYRDLNPVWDESFTIPVEDPFVPIHIKVFDYDWGLQDDFMGSAFLDLTSLELGRATDLQLPLQDPARPTGQRGEIALTITLWPRTQEDKDQDISEAERTLTRNFKRLVHRASTTDLDSPVDVDHQQLRRICSSSSSEESDTLLSAAPPPAAKSRLERVICDLEGADEVQHCGSDGNLLERLGQRLKERSGKVHRYFQKNSKISDVNRRLKSQIWSSVVTLVLVEGRNLLAMDPESASSDPYVKFRLGNEKYKSRVVWRSLNPRWLEQFDLHLYDDGDQQLELTVWDKDRARDDFIGRCVIDLSLLERERTHGFWQELEDGAGSLYLLLTISGTTASETISDLTTYEDNPKERETLEARYSWPRTLHNVKDVGHLTVKVFRGSGLAAADLGGKSDPFCVLELGNARLQTQTEYKTLAPSWQKIFTFNVKDINNVLEVTVYDEDRDHKVEFLGKVCIPLLKVRNGERKWYPLKDKKLRSRAKGANPQILLELTVLWNPVRACIRTLNPKEEKYMQAEVKFKRQVFVRNVLRLKVITMALIDFGKCVQSCFEWESTLQSFLALVLWLILCYYFQPWMLPTIGLLIFLKQYIVRSLAGPIPLPGDEGCDSDLDDDDDDDKDKEEKKSLKERLQAIQEVTQTVQNAIGHIASLGEAVKNTFNFTVPYLSWIAIALFLGATVVLYLIPVRYLLMLWGSNKFARRLLRPHSVPNNEVMDLLSRMPDDELLEFLQALGTGLSTKPGTYAIFKFLQLDYRDLKPLMGPEPDRRRDPRKKHKVS